MKNPKKRHWLLLLLLTTCTTFAAAGILEARSKPTDERFAQQILIRGTENVELVGHVGGIYSPIVVRDNLAYMGQGPRLLILDATAWPEKVVVGQSKPMSGIIKSIILNQGRVYANTGPYAGNVHVIDVSTPTNPIETIFIERVSVSQMINENLALGSMNGHRGILDLSKPQEPSMIGDYEVSASICDFAVSGSHLYLATDDAGLLIFDISEPTQPTQVGQYAAASNFRTVAAGDNYAFVAGIDSGLRIVDISDPSDPFEVGNYSSAESAVDLKVAGQYLYLSNEGPRGRLEILDVNIPNQPMLVGIYFSSSYHSRMTISDDLLYISDGNFRVIDISEPTLPKEIAFFPSLSFLDVEVVGNYALVAAGRAGLGFIDIRHPGSPEITSFFPTSGYLRAVAVSDNLAYLADQDAGLIALDISDPMTPSEMAIIEESDALDVEIDGDYVYAMIGSRFQVYDARDPASPIRAGAIGLPRHGGKLDVQNNFVYVANGPVGLRIIDVSSADAPFEVGFADTYYGESVAVECDYAYLVGDLGDSGFVVFDVTNPSIPAAISYGRSAGQGLTMAGDKAYIAAGYSGLRIYDISDPKNPVEIGYFGTLGNAEEVAVKDDLIYLVDPLGGLYILRYAEGTGSAAVSGTANPSFVGVSPANSPETATKADPSADRATDDIAGEQLASQSSEQVRSAQNATDPSESSETEARSLSRTRLLIFGIMAIGIAIVAFSFVAWFLLRQQPATRNVSAPKSFCPHCGADNPPSGKFCIDCGNRLAQ